MKVFHGSYIAITEIDLTKSRGNRDFGQGFYVTKIRSQAELWAKRIGRIHRTKGIVSEFIFYDNAFINWDLNCLRFENYSEEWLDFVIANRDPKSPVLPHNYDIVEGPVANDDVNNRIIDYLANRVSKADFLQELSFHKPTHQICLCTLKSLQMIEPVVIDYYIDVKHISRPIIEALVKERRINEKDAADMLYNSKIFSLLSDKSTGLYEHDWQSIYTLLQEELRTNIHQLK
jgi:hypothetical protein